MVQAVKNMVQHEPHFTLEVVDNGFGSLAMGVCMNLRSRRVFNLKRLIKRDKGANGFMSGSRVGVVWMEVGGGIVRARVVSRVVVMVVWMVLRGFWIEELALEAIELDDQGMEYEKVSSCREWVQECSCPWDHSPPIGEELEKVNRMTWCREELELGDEAFFLYP
ncbi:hypothetical protein Tco_0450038 [Tanacetum coccineum]